MEDLEQAKSRIHGKRLTLSIVKDGEIIFETGSHRISGFLDAIEEFGNELQGASLADRVAGRAVALLCAYARIKAVYASILSRKAKSVLEQNRIYYEWENLVESILDVDKKRICPFEKLAEEITNPEDFYRILKALRNSLKQRR